VQPEKENANEQDQGDHERGGSYEQSICLSWRCDEYWQAVRSCRVQGGGQGDPQSILSSEETFLLATTGYEDCIVWTPRLVIQIAEQPQQA
jgi:hypothetical protein